MRRLYKALGIASAQDVRDLQASTASLHERVARLETSHRCLRAERLERTIEKLQAKLDTVERAIGVGGFADQQTVERIQAELEGLIAGGDARSIDPAFMTRSDEVQELDFDALVNQVRDNLGIDKLVTSAVQRADIGGEVAMHLKHADWSIEATIC